MAHQAPAVSGEAQATSVARLAKFFPQATPLRLPVRVSREVDHDVFEHTTLEFGTAREVLFASSFPLEFAEKLRLQNSDGSLDAEASVVAVRYQPGRTAVAARFAREIPNWIVKL